jgi:hypothetical protein
MDSGKKAKIDPSGSAMSSSLKLFRNSARQTIVAAANRIAPHSNAVVRRNLAPALWARSFASGGFLPKEEVLERVTTVVKNFQNVDPAKVSPTSHFMNDLGLDSLDTVEVRPSCLQCPGFAIADSSRLPQPAARDPDQWDDGAHASRGMSAGTRELCC